MSAPMVGNQSAHSRITGIIRNPSLATDIERSIAVSMASPRMYLPVDDGVWNLFKHGLDAAIRDISMHPRGQLLRRLLEHGPHAPDTRAMPEGDGKTTLSDGECGTCLEFVYSHMVNRFQGELAELLAMEPCLILVDRLAAQGRLAAGVRVYWGDLIRQRRRVRVIGVKEVRWGGYAKGADGLLAEVQPGDESTGVSLALHGAVEVKSMRHSIGRVAKQVDRHIARLRGGVMLGDRVWEPSAVTLPAKGIGGPGFVRVVAMPSGGKLSRQSGPEVTEDSRPPGQPSSVDQLATDLWKITLAWSHEALAQAAYEMTFWYMSQVGAYVFESGRLPKTWEQMSPEEAGRNAIKQMLYFMLLRPLSMRQLRIATRLYNTYGFGFPQAMDTRSMLWPGDT